MTNATQNKFKLSNIVDELIAKRQNGKKALTLQVMPNSTHCWATRWSCSSKFIATLD